MINKCEQMAEWELPGETEVLEKKKTRPSANLSTKNPTWNRTRAAAAEASEWPPEIWHGPTRYYISLSSFNDAFSTA
jgi:hypothetical protein